MRTGLSLFLTGLFILVAGIQTRTQAADSALADSIRKLFDAGASSSVAARREVDEQVESLKEQASADPRVSYAVAVTLIGQSRQPEANKILKELVERDDVDLHTLRSRVWALTLLKDYSSALVQLDRLGQLLADAPPEDTETRDQFLRFLGRVLGYYEGPAMSASTERLVASARRKIEARLTDGQHEVFDEGTRAVEDQFDRLTQTKTESVEAAEQRVAAEREQTLQDVAEERVRIDEKRDTLDEDRTRLRQELNDQLAAIAESDRPLASQLARLQAQGAVASRDLAAINLDIVRLEDLIDRETDPFIRDRYIRERNQLVFVARRYSADLAALERQAASVVAERNELARRRLEVERSIGGELGDVEKELDDLGQQNKRADAIERRARRTKANSTRARTLTLQASAFTTYEPFPLEQEKQRILDSLK